MLVSDSFFIEPWDSCVEAQIHNTSFDWFCMALPLYLRKGFRFRLKKNRESPYSCKFSHNILSLCISYFSKVQNEIPHWLNWIPRKFLKNDKLFDLEIYNVKLKCTDISFIKAICRNPTSSFKMEIRLVYTEENVRKETKKSWAAKLNCSIFQPSTIGHRNHFNIYVSLAVDCEINSKKFTAFWGFNYKNLLHSN